MNKIYKIIWSKARNCYVAVSEIATSHSKGSKRVRAAVVAAVVAASFAGAGIANAEVSTGTSSANQYTVMSTSAMSALSGVTYSTTTTTNDTATVTVGSNKLVYKKQSLTIDGATKTYWVRENYQIALRNYKTTDLSTSSDLVDIIWTKGGTDEPSDLLSTVTALQKTTGTHTNLSESLETITPTKIEGFTNAGTDIGWTWSYILVDDSWELSDGIAEKSNGYVDVKSSNGPVGFTQVSTDSTTNKNTAGGYLKWDSTENCYMYTDADGESTQVSYSNLYVINGKLGVFTKKDGSLYTGNVYGKNNEILATGLGDDGSYYSYWGSTVTDPSLTMEKYPVSQYKTDLDTLVSNDEKLARNDIRSVETTTDATKGTATITLYRNGSDTTGTAADGAITISKTETEGKDTKVTITGTYQAADGTTRTTSTYDITTGSRVSVTKGTADSAAKITVNGEDTTIGYTKGTSSTDSFTIDNANNTISVKTDGTVKEGDTNIVSGGTVYTYITNNTANQDLSNITDTGKSNIVKAAADAVVVAAGTNITSVTSATDADTGVKTYTVNAKDTTLDTTATKQEKTTDNGYTITVADTDNNSKTFTDLASNKDLTDLSTNVTNLTTKVNSLDTNSVKYSDDTKTTVTLGDGKGTAGTTDPVAGTDKDGNTTSTTTTTYDGKSYTDKTVVTTDKITGETTTTTTHSGGVTINNVHYADGKDGSEAVNVDKLTDTVKEATDSLTSKGLNFKGDTAGDDKVIHKDLDETLEITGGATGTLTDNNIGVVSDGSKLTVKLASALSGITSITNGSSSITLNTNGGTTISGGNVSVSGNKITNVADGTDSTDAVNKKQLDDAIEDVTDDLSDLDDYAVKYGTKTEKVTIDGEEKEQEVPDYSTVTLAGTTYSKGDTTTGTHLTNVAYATGEDGSEAVNVDYLKDTVANTTSELTDKGFGLIGTETGSVAATKKLGENVLVDGENGITVSSTAAKVTVSLSKNITVGTAGKDGKDGEQGTIGIAGANGTNGVDGSTLVNITVKDGEKGLDGKDGTNLTRIVYTDATGEHQVATMEDGLKFKGDDSTVISKKLNNEMDILGGATGTLTEGNIGVVSDNGALRVKLASALSGITSITNGKSSITLNEDGGVTINTNTGTEGSKGVTITNENKITNVGSGDISENSTDAVNGSDVYTAIKNASDTLTNNAVKYDKKDDGTVDYTKVTLGDGKTEAAYSNKTGGTTLTNVAYATVTDKTDPNYDGSQAVNMDRLNDSIATATSATTTKLNGLLTVNGGEAATDNYGQKGSLQLKKTVDADGNVTAYDVKLSKDVIVGTAGTKGTDGTDGKDGEQGTIGIAGANGTNGVDGTTLVNITVKNGENTEAKDGKDGQQGEKGVDGTNLTRIVYTDATGDHQVATMEDGLKFKGDDDTVISKKLNNEMDILGGATGTLTEGNIGVVSGTDGALHIKLANALAGINSITNGNTTITLNTSGGVTVSGGNVNVSGNKITNVGSGTIAEGSTDAVNGGDVYNAIKDAKDSISNLDKGAVQYDKNTDGSVNYDKVTLGNSKDFAKESDSTIIIDGNSKITTTTHAGKSYKDVTTVTPTADGQGTTATTTHTGGTTITNVSYATVTDKSDKNYDGSQAVNMDRLNDSIDEAINNATTTTTANEKHIQDGTYSVSNDNRVTMNVVDGNEKDTGKTVVINDVAKASDLGNLNNLNSDLKNQTGTDASGNPTYGDTNMVDVVNKLDSKIDDIRAKAEATRTGVTVNGGEEATGNYGQTGNLQLKETSENGKTTYDLKLNDKVQLGEGDNKITVDGTSGAITVGEGVNKVLVDGNKGTITVGTDTNTKITVDGSTGAITVGEGEKKVTIGSKSDGNVTANDMDISDKLTVGDLSFSTMSIGNLTTSMTVSKPTVKDGTVTSKPVEMAKGDALTGSVASGMVNTTTRYDKYANGTGKAATEEQLKEVVGDADFSKTTPDKTTGTTTNNYNIVNGAENVTDAIGKLDQNATAANTNIQKINTSLNHLNTRVNRVGAGAAALAALHPLDFDPDDKWDFAAGYGNYAGANAAAVGAYYRPNEDTMFSVAGSFGGGENMVNAGVSVKLGQGNHVTTSKVAMAKEIKSLRETVAQQGAQIAQLVELVNKLTGGEAALQPIGQAAEDFTVDTVKEENGQPVVQRVRTVKK